MSEVKRGDSLAGRDPRLRIPLTDRRPVEVRTSQWPVVARGHWDDHDAEIRMQANRTWTCRIRVRQHADGRAVVYGYGTAWQHEHCVDGHAGTVVEAGGDIAGAIGEVAASLQDITARVEGASEHIADAARECLADLPAEVL